MVNKIVQSSHRIFGKNVELKVMDILFPLFIMGVLKSMNRVYLNGFPLKILEGKFFHLIKMIKEIYWRLNILS